MSDITPAAPAVPAAAPAVPAAAPAAPAAAPVLASSLPDEALTARLASARNAERTKLLAELGVADLDTAKTALATAKAEADARKSDLEKSVEAQTALAAENATLSTQAKALSTYAELELGKLTEAQKAAVTLAAGEKATPDAILTLITALRPTWAVEPVAPATPAAAPVAPAAPAALGTSANPGPPEATTPTSVDHAAIYQQLKADGKVHQAYVYLNRHPSALKD